MNILIRISLTILLVIWASMPYFDNANSENALNAILSIGIIGSVLIVLAFFIMVAFYCKTLQTCLTLIQPENRKAKPKSVWYMFLLPFNFIEDFFIVINIANSIEAEARTNKKLSDIKDFGMVTGIGWSIAQVLSFIPNYIGQIAGLIGFILVISHWIFIHKINRLLSDKINLNKEYLAV